MTTQQTLSALQRAAGALQQACNAYVAAVPTGKPGRARRELTSAMDAYETAYANHQKALARQIEIMGSDPRRVKGL